MLLLWPIDMDAASQEKARMAAKTADRPLATVESPVTMSRNQMAKISDERARFYRAERWGRERCP